MLNSIKENFTILYSHHQLMSFQVPHISYNFWWGHLFLWIHASGFLVVVHCVFNLYFLDDQWYWAFFSQVFIGHSHSSVSTKLVTILKIGSFVVLLLCYKSTIYNQDISHLSYVCDESSFFPISGIFTVVPSYPQFYFHGFNCLWSTTVQKY